jgi:hypothetical protein
MSCNVPIPSIEAYITPPHLASKTGAHENPDHHKCLHHFFEHPFVLPDSVPDGLVEFPGELNTTVPPRSPPRPIVRKPPTLAHLHELPQSERNKRVRDLLEGSLLLAHFKLHAGARQIRDTPMRKPLGSLLLQEAHQKLLPRLAINTFSRNIPRQPPR